ncbi:MAG: SLC45 family MFS transporter [Clostridiales bacterium]|nr:SLC45 family MFS transporter [Clostridiales bacterium]
MEEEIKVAEPAAEEKPAFKLNYKRTFTIGFAFFGILLLWQVYDTWCPTFLTELFKSAFNKESDQDVQYLVGVMMALDNLAALILLPIFGRLSDKTKSPLGKRMPYILVGTFVCAVAFPFIPVFFHNNNLVGTIAMMAIVLVFAMMYRNPAVALMPDMTPKPLRSKANGIINIMGYIGGAFATVVGMIFVLSKYLKALLKSVAFGQLKFHSW